MTEEDLPEDWESDETQEERLARESIEVTMDEYSQATVDKIVDRMMLVIDELSGHPLYGYQRPFARRFVESIIIGDGATLTALFSRQCLDGDTVVFRQDGTATRLRELPDVIPTGVKPTKRYKMRGGAEVIMTDNHPVYTPGGWVPAGALRPGDLVSAVSEVNHWGQVDSKADLGRWLGYFTTDGSNTSRQSAKFTNTREEYLSEFADLTVSLFGITPKRYEKGNGADLLLTTKRGQSNPVRTFLANQGWDHKFPTAVFSWTPEALSEFVNRAWAGDGCISMKKTGPDIFLACGNDEVYARYWQALLLKFGVMSTVKPEQMAKGTGTFYRLVVGCGALNVKRFFQSFGLIFDKEEQSLAAIDYFATKALRPSGKGHAEREMYKERGWGPDGERLVWSKVISIEDAGEREVFDLHVEGKGWFVAQGLQVSNSGKSETVANTVAACMIMFPLLARLFPDLLRKFREGMWVGAFAPVDDQADNLYGRIVSRLSSDRALEILQDPEVDVRLQPKGKTMTLSNGSLVRKQTAHPRATIEGRTYHVILIDECQGADERVVSKSINPMGAATNATKVWTGTPTYTKGIFYKQIQYNRRNQLRRGKNIRQNHFEADWREAAKWNPDYEKYVKSEMLVMGEDSDEFRLSYRLQWLLDKGQFVTADRLDDLGDVSMHVVPAWNRTPILIGIDPARKQDSTIVTAVWVDWDHPDEFGYYEHRVLNWLDLTGVDWEEQYARIVDFVRNYRVFQIGIDSGGVGDVVADRLKRLLPDIEVIELGSQRPDQSRRWKHLMELIERRKIGWPAHSKTRRLKTYRRFRQQMEDLEKKFEGPYVLAAAPREADAHDDYPDSLALAVVLSRDFTLPEVEVSTAPFYSR